MFDDDRTMVERKLSGVFTTINYEIPWKWFQYSIESMHENLKYDYDLDIPIDDLIENKIVLEHYNRCLKEAINDGELAYIEDYRFDADYIFRKEIAAREKELARIAAEEEKRIKEQEAAELAILNASMAQIHVPHKKLDKAVIILKAAGIIK